jgi:hypothetical protein
VFVSIESPRQFAVDWYQRAEERIVSSFSLDPISNSSSNPCLFMQTPSPKTTSVLASPKTNRWLRVNAIKFQRAQNRTRKAKQLSKMSPSGAHK